MSEDQANQAQQVKPEQINTRRTEAQASVGSAFTEMYKNTRHIAEQTDKIAEHLLDGQSTPRRQAARSLLAQLSQIARTQALMVDMMEEILGRLPPMPEQGQRAPEAGR